MTNYDRGIRNHQEREYSVPSYYKASNKGNQLQEETTPAVPLLLYDSENVYTVVLKFSTWGIGRAMLVIQKWIRLEVHKLIGANTSRRESKFL